MNSLGDFDASTVVYGKFTTYRPSTGAPYTLAGTPALSVYKDNSTTQSTTGVTLTADFDSVTGLNHFAIDTSADGTFYAAGSFFDVVITTGTVDSVSAVGTVVGRFTLKKTSAGIATTSATHGNAALKTLIDTLDDFVDTEVAAIKAKTDNLPSDPADASDIASSFTTVNSKLDAIDDYVDTEIAAINTRLAGLVMAQGTIGSTGNDTTHLHLTGLTYGDDEINNCMLVIFDVSTSEYHARWVEDWADTGDLVTVATLPFTPQDATDTYWLLPIRQDVTGGSGLDAAGVRAAVGLASANLDTQLGAIDDFLDTEIAAIKAKTDNLPADPADASDIASSFSTVNTKLDTIDDFLDTEIAAIKTVTDAIGTTGTGLSAVPWNAAWDAEVQSEVQDAIEANNLDHLVKIAVDTNFATTVHLDSVIGQIADNGTTATFDRTTDSQEAIRDRGDAAWVTATGFSTLSQADVRTAVGLASANLDTQLTAIDDYLDTEIAAIKAKTDNLPSDPADASDIASSFSTVNSTLATIAAYIDTEVSAILEDTGTTIPAQISALNNLSIAQAQTAAAAALTAYDPPTHTELTTALAAADDAVLAAIAALNNLSAAQVNAEVVDALATDTYAEPGQGAPAATTTIAAKINYLFKAWRNKITQTSTETKLFADDGTTVDQKSTVSDDGTTFTKGEMGTGA